MGKAAILQSIDADRDGIGLRAARHMARVFRTLTAGRGGEERDAYFRWVTGEPHPLGNVVMLADEADDAVVRDAAGPLVGGGFPSAMLFPGQPSASARHALVAAGFTDSAGIPAMAIDIANLARTGLPPGYAFVRVGADHRSDEWAGTLATGYGLPAGLARRFAPSFVDADPAEDAAAQFFAVVRDGRIVATSMLFLDDGLAGIYSVATLPEDRGRGLGAHLTAEPLRIARSLGYRVGVLQSSTMGHPVYLGLGFVDVGGLEMVARMPG